MKLRQRKRLINLHTGLRNTIDAQFARKTFQLSKSKWITLSQLGPGEAGTSLFKDYIAKLKTFKWHVSPVISKRPKRKKNER